MVEITDLEIEWATVSRMRHMLTRVDPEYEITQTYTLFTGILCWTLQRIRSHTDGSDVAQKMDTLKNRLKSDLLSDFLPELCLDRHPNINSLKSLEKFSALHVLKLLRDAVAHGDARVVSPINTGHQLTGFHIVTKENKSVILDIKLDRKGMTIIADKVASHFCEALIQNSTKGFLCDAAKISETKQEAG